MSEEGYCHVLTKENSVGNTIHNICYLVNKWQSPSAVSTHYENRVKDEVTNKILQDSNSQCFSGPPENFRGSWRITR